MSTTTIRLPEELKMRVAKAAKRAGTTPHGFILDAIASRTEAQERQDDFHGEADRRYAEILETGLTVPWAEMRAYLLKRAEGIDAPRPKARKLGR